MRTPSSRRDAIWVVAIVALALLLERAVVSYGIASNPQPIAAAFKLMAN